MLRWTCARYPSSRARSSQFPTSTFQSRWKSDVVRYCISGDVHIPPVPIVVSKILTASSGAITCSASVGIATLSTSSFSGSSSSSICFARSTRRRSLTINGREHRNAHDCSSQIDNCTSQPFSDDSLCGAETIDTRRGTAIPSRPETRQAASARNDRRMDAAARHS